MQITMNNRKFIRFLILGVVLASALVAGFFIYKDFCQKAEVLPEESTDSEQAETSSEIEAEERKNKEQQPEQIEIKSSVNLDVPFTPQAPYAVWDELHNEACEEAAVIIVEQYLKGDRRSKIPAAEADEKIRAQVQWQISRLGVHKDLTAAEIVKYLAKEYLERSQAQVHDFSVDNIKQELSKGKPVIVPAAGRLLGNPYFKRPGPVYHMVVIVGYDSKYFITNDPGTRRGYKFKYTFDRIQYAVHDWAGSEGNIETGQRVYITLN